VPLPLRSVLQCFGFLRRERKLHFRQAYVLVSHAEDDLASEFSL
jgi:hypothetical protein